MTDWIWTFISGFAAGSCVTLLVAHVLACREHHAWCKTCDRMGEFMAKMRDEHKAELESLRSLARDLERETKLLWKEKQCYQRDIDDQLKKLREAAKERFKYRRLLRKIVAGNWCVTEVQEILGDIQAAKAAGGGE